MTTIYDTREGARLATNGERTKHWARWGPYLAERAWGTVREDYSAGGEAWGYFPHDHARSRAYRWNEDGLGGICDRRQHLCFALSLWNGRDPFLKERMFGLTRARGEPRRGRQGLLLLPRLDADALVHEVPLQVPAGRVPLRPARRGEPPPGQDAAGVRAGRHRDLRRVPLLRRRRRVRQGRGRRPPDPHQRQQPRPGGGADRGAADALVPQHLELGPRRPPPVDRGAAPGRGGPCSPRTGTSASTPSTAPAPTSCSSPRTRRTPRGCTAPRRRPLTSRTPSTRASWAAGARPSIRPPPGRRPPRAMPVPSAPARRSPSSCAWPRCAAGSLLEAPFAGFDAVFQQRKEEADEFYAAVLPPGSSA